MDAQEYVCSNCDREFRAALELIDHVLREHTQTRENGGSKVARKIITRSDFVQVDSHWIYVLGMFHLSLAANQHGEFKLTVFGSVEPIPPATLYPTEPEWEQALEVANKFLEAYRVASRD